MTALPHTGPSLAFRLLSDGLPLTLLLDLVDPEGMRAGLACELLVTDVALTAAPPQPARQFQTA